MEEVDSSDISTVEQKFVPKEISFEPSEDQELARSCIEEIREWISTNEEFYGRTDDSFILRFLRVCKYDVEKTKQRIYRNYKIEHNNPKWFSKTKEQEEMLEELIGKKLYYLMDYAGNFKHQMVIFNTAGLYPMKYRLEPMVCLAGALFPQICAEDSRCQTEGVIYVGDYGHLKWDMVLQATPSLIWRVLTLVTGGVPLKFKGIHLLNVPGIANTALRCIRYFLSKKLRKRLFVHDNADSLFEHVPREYLPFELGGTAGPAQTFADATCKIVKDATILLEDRKKYGINKSTPHSENSSRP